MYNIRNYTSSDYNTISNWSHQRGMGVLKESMIPSTTYIVEKEGQPVVTGCLFLMNCEAGCMVENILSNPEFDGNREGATQFLFSKLEDKAKNLGYNTMVIFSYEPKIKQLYETLGFTKTLENVTTFAKEIK